MQLLKACAEAPVVSNEELLMLENEFLRNELELKDIENSIEIYECILDCIEKTGGVDKSLEVMFGENVSSSENFEAEIKAQYEGACEGFMDAIKAGKATANAFLEKVYSSIKSKIQKFKKVKASAFPLKLEVPAFATDTESYNKSIVPVLKKIREAHNEDKSDITDQEKAEFREVLNAKKVVEVANSHELFNIGHKVWGMLWQLSSANDVNSLFAKKPHSMYSKGGRDLLAMQRAVERVMRNFNNTVDRLYKTLPYEL